MFFGESELPGFVQVRHLDADGSHQAVDLHLERYERELSFTDAALVCLAREHGCPVASFDAHFDGIVLRVSS